MIDWEDFGIDYSEDLFDDFLFETESQEEDENLGFICRYCMLNSAEEEWGSCEENACMILMQEDYPEAFLGRF